MEAKIKAGSWDGYPGGVRRGFAFERLNGCAHRACGARERYLGLRSAADTRPTNHGINQPWHWITIPIMGIDHGRDILCQGTLADDCGRRQGLRIHGCLAPSIPITGAVRFAHQPAGNQIA